MTTNDQDNSPTENGAMTREKAVPCDPKDTGDTTVANEAPHAALEEMQATDA